MWLSLRREITIISADSRQIYRGFDVGTATPATDERRRVPHRGVDIVEPSARYSAADWSAMATAAIDEALALGRIPLIVGGTGFYIRALVRPLFAEPELDAERREALQGALAREETDTLRRWCELLDPRRAHLGRVQLLRALEVAMLTGRRLSDLHAERARPNRVEACYLLVDPGAVLASRIAARTQEMIDAGWIGEVRRLLDTVPDDYVLAVEILNTRRLIKGYSDTHARAHSKFDRVLSALPILKGRPDAADWLRRLREAALKDEKGDMLVGALKTVATLGG